MFRGLRPPARLLRIPTRRIHTTPFLSVQKQRIDALLDPLTRKYADAKDEYEISIESLGTTYAKDDIASAKELTEEVVKEYKSMLHSDSIVDEEKKVIRERVGQRVRELVAAVEANLKEEDT